MSPDEVAGVRPGDVLAGKYRIDRILGAGGMGVVVAAHHIRLDDRVAIKFLLPEMLLSGEAVARFEREARAAVKIKSEHVARVSDVGTLENGAPYMVMEYLEGGDLSAWLAQRGPLSVAQATEFVLQACEAIAEAHALGIVHRDLKPANLFVIRRPDGASSVKVLDFGISKMRAGGSSSVPDVSITKTSAMMGSPLYMSPEQMQSAKDVDPRADIWALGVILYELLAGTSPFHAESIPELVAKILSMPPPSLTARRPDVPVGLEAVIFKCLEKDARQRFESVGQLAGALIAFAPTRSRISLERISGVMRSAGFASPDVGPEPDVPVVPTHPGLQAPAITANTRERTIAAFGSTSAPTSNKALALVLAAVGVVGAGVAVALFLLLRRPAPSELDRVAPTVAAEQPPAPAPAAKTEESPATPSQAPAAAPAPSPAPAEPASAATPAPAAPTPAAAARTPRPGGKTAPAAKAAGPSAAPAPAAAPAAPTPAPARDAPNAFDDRK